MTRGLSPRRIRWGRRRGACAKAAGASRLQIFTAPAPRKPRAPAGFSAGPAGEKARQTRTAIARANVPAGASPLRRQARPLSSDFQAMWYTGGMPVAPQNHPIAANNPQPPFLPGPFAIGGMASGLPLSSGCFDRALAAALGGNATRLNRLSQAYERRRSACALLGRGVTVATDFLPRQHTQGKRDLRPCPGLAGRDGEIAEYSGENHRR